MDRMNLSQKILIWTCLIFLAVVVAARMYLSRTPSPQEESEPASLPAQEALSGGIEQDFFAEARLERDRVRSRRIELLEEISHSQESTQESRTRAEQDLASLTSRMEKEARVESLLRAKGFKDALVYINDNSCDVIVATSGLTAAVASQIGDIVSRVAGIPLDRISIIEHKS
ncbi:MAG: SpoIIIAH-like family protein [Firmicutes bacterium]|nr:SpoIIIAH-like family protein [Bacillota bacterium]